METFELVKTLIQGGIAGILGIGLVIVWKTWRDTEEKHAKELKQQAADYQITIENKNKIIEQLASLNENITKQANTRLDRMVQMIADGGVATQKVLAENAAAMAVNQIAITDMKEEIKQLRQAIERIRGG